MLLSDSGLSSLGTNVFVVFLQSLVLASYVFSFVHADIGGTVAYGPLSTREFIQSCVPVSIGFLLATVPEPNTRGMEKGSGKTFYMHSEWPPAHPTPDSLFPYLWGKHEQSLQLPRPHWQLRRNLFGSGRCTRRKKKGHCAILIDMT